MLLPFSGVHRYLFVMFARCSACDRCCFIVTCVSNADVCKLPRLKVLSLHTLGCCDLHLLLVSSANFFLGSIACCSDFMICPSLISSAHNYLTVFVCYKTGNVIAKVYFDPLFCPNIKEM